MRNLLELGVATAIALLIVGQGQLDAARYGPTVTAAQARAMAEFQPGGRASYFVPGWYQFWLESSRSGFALGPQDPVLEAVPAMAIPFALSVVLGAWMLAGRLGWTAPPAVPRAGLLLLVLLGASLALFFAAHWLLFVLYLPARHVQFSLPLVWAMAGGLCWALLGERLVAKLGAWRRSPTAQTVGLPTEPPSGWLVKTGLSGAELFSLLGIGLLALLPPPPGEFYVTGRHPAIYAYLRQTPPDTLVAALPADSSILPLFGQRGVLTSFEHSLPYHPGYYRPLYERTEAFRAAYYAPTLAPLVDVVKAQGIDLVIADTEALERRRRAEREHPPALEEVLDRCGILRERELVVLPVACIEEAAAASG
jgi:hypothetical protein